jgi:hypothetical protein
VDQFECGSGIEVEPEHRRRIFGRCLPATVGLKIFAVPSAKRPAPPSFRRSMAVPIYRWIAFPKALGLSNPCTASTFIVLRATAQRSPNDPPQNALDTQPTRLIHFGYLIPRRRSRPPTLTILGLPSGTDPFPSTNKVRGLFSISKNPVVLRGLRLWVTCG